MESITMHGRFEGDGDVRAFYLALAYQTGDWLITNVKVKFKGKRLRLQTTAMFDVWYCGEPEDYIDINVWMKEFLESILECESKISSGCQLHVFIQSCKPYIKGDKSMGERSNYFFPENV